MWTLPMSLSLQDPQQKQQWKHLLTSSFSPSRQFSKQLDCVHDCTFSACMLSPGYRKGKRGIQKRQDCARKENLFQNHPIQMLTDQAGSQKHLGEVTGLLYWFIVKFPLYPSKLSFLCTTCEMCISNTLLQHRTKCSSSG